MGQPNTVSPQARQALTDFVVEMKSTGFVQHSLSRHKIEGAAIAP
jgi:hypothetical protein